jgi:hypothetical protein
MRESLWDSKSIFPWKTFPEAAFVKKVAIDAHRSKQESIASGWLHRSARPILPQASPVWKAGTSQIVAFEHAKASAALAASCKSLFHSSKRHKKNSNALSSQRNVWQG